MNTTQKQGEPSTEMLREYLQDFDSSLAQQVLERVNNKGYHQTIIYYLSKVDTVFQLLAGRLEVARIHNVAPANLDAYLELMRPHMRKARSKLQVNTPSNEVSVNLTQPEHIIQLKQYHDESLKIVKEDEPNNTWLFLHKHKEELQKVVDHSLDLYHNYHSISVMKVIYLTKTTLDGEVIERPQFAFLRMAAQFYADTSLSAVINAYREMANFEYVHASPTIFNAGTTIPQMSSCFLQTIHDTTESIVDTYKSVALISRSGGANGVSLGEIRSGTRIGLNGFSSGAKMEAKVLDSITTQFNQQGRRAGATQVSLPIWHVDIPIFLSLFDRTGKPGEFVENLFWSIMTTRLFLRRSAQDEEWSFFCPSETPMLLKTYGEEFEKWYTHYEGEGLAKMKMSARVLHEQISELRKNTGMPFISLWDTVNGKTNQSNIHDGIIKTLNLCMEIAQVSGNGRIPSCNLSSTCLPTFLTLDTQQRVTFDWQRYAKAIRSQVRNLNKVIEKNYYPTPEILASNLEVAPIGIGSQGFATLLAEMDIIFDSPEALELSERLQACAYYNALLESMTIAKERGRPYSAFAGSPFSKGILQFDMWQETLGARPLVEPKEWEQEGSWEWLKEQIKTYGVANSQLTTAQPTASCAQIPAFKRCGKILSGMSEAWEPFYGTLFKRKTIAGEFIVCNQHLQDDLKALDLWNDDSINFIRKMDGSIKGLSSVFLNLPEEKEKRLHVLEEKYKNTFEVRQKTILNQAAARGRYIDASQSTNLSWNNISVKKIMEADHHASNLGLKTLGYYTRSKSAVNAYKVTLVEKPPTESIPTQSIELNPDRAPMCNRSPDCLACT